MTHLVTSPGDTSDCAVALKEWAVVCAAIASGRQSILLRKGGIDEGPAGFRFEHCRFWLYPTRFHTTAAQLTAAGAALLAGRSRNMPAVSASGTIEVELELVCETRRVFHIADRSRLSVLEGLHVLSPETVESRFDYRAPGLFVAVIDAARAGVRHRIVETPHYSGCHSWVELTLPLPVGSLDLLTDSEHQARLVERFSRELSSG